MLNTKHIGKALALTYLLNVFDMLATLRRQSLARRPIGESPMAYQLRDLGHSHLMAMPF